MAFSLSMHRLRVRLKAPYSVYVTIRHAIEISNPCKLYPSHQVQTTHSGKPHDQWTWAKRKTRASRGAKSRNTAVILHNRDPRELDNDAEHQLDIDSLAEEDRFGNLDQSAISRLKDFHLENPAEHMEVNRNDRIVQRREYAKKIQWKDYQTMYRHGDAFDKQRSYHQDHVPKQHWSDTFGDIAKEEQRVQLGTTYSQFKDKDRR